MLTRVLPIAGLLLSGLAAAGADDAPRQRSFEFDYHATLAAVPAGAKSVELWLPVPHSNDYQQITGLRVDAPVPYTVEKGNEGNTMLHVRLDSPQEGPLKVGIHFQATREEHLQPRLAAGARLAADESSDELARYLKPDRLVPLDDKIRTWAREVVEKAGAHTDLEMARAIYDHIVATVKYDKTGKGWGRGDIYYACDARRGNCTDFHAIFIGYARALGIPARFAIGFPLPAARGEGAIAGYHCWAEFYAKGIGWVPIDASEAAKNPAKREYFFGAHDENRVEFSRGRDVILEPRQGGDPLNFFVYPYAEVDGQPLAGVTYEVRYRDEAGTAEQTK
jgi:transglutaminase-like putative cysteine protease